MTYYINPGSVIAVAIVLPVLGLACVVARFCIRRKRKAVLGPDDWLCIPALILEFGLAAIMIAGSATKTIGYSTPPSSDVVAAQNAATKQQILFSEFEVSFYFISFPTIGFIKLSLLFFYRRIFRGRTFDICSWSVIILVIAWSITFLITEFGGCGSHFVQGLFGSPEDLKIYCFNTFDNLGAMAISDFILDVLIMLLPLFWIWTLHMSRMKKLGVSAVFLIGTFATIAGCVRMIVIISIMDFAWGTDDEILGLKGTNFIGVASTFIFWSFIEIGVGMITCNLPSLRPLFDSLSAGSFLSSLRGLLSLNSLRSTYQHENNPQQEQEGFSRSTALTPHQNLAINNIYTGKLYTVIEGKAEDKKKQEDAVIGQS